MAGVPKVLLLVSLDKRIVFEHLLILLYQWRTEKHSAQNLNF